MICSVDVRLIDPVLLWFLLAMNDFNWIQTRFKGTQLCCPQMTMEPISRHTSSFISSWVSFLSDCFHVSFHRGKATVVLRIIQVQPLKLLQSQGLVTGKGRNRQHQEGMCRNISQHRVEVLNGRKRLYRNSAKLSYMYIHKAFNWHPFKKIRVHAWKITLYNLLLTQKL